jgi:hypothetical protein
MSIPYLGPSRLDLLVLIARYNADDSNAPKIPLGNSIIIDHTEYLMVQGRLIKELAPKSQVQVDIDTCINQLWKLKKVVDGITKFKAKEWERVIWAAKAMAVIAEKGKEEFESGVPKAGQEAEREAGRRRQPESIDLENEGRRQKEFERQQNVQLQQKREMDSRHDSQRCDSGENSTAAARPSHHHPRNPRQTPSQLKPDTLLRKAEDSARATKPGIRQENRLRKDQAKSSGNLKEEGGREEKARKMAEAHESALRLASEVRKFD